MPHLSPIVSAGDSLFLSGQLAFTDTGELVTGDVSIQTTRCLENLERLLKREGLDRRAIVKTTVWLTDAADFADFDAAYAGFFGDHRPARSTTVAALVVKGAAVEIDAVAVR